MKSKLMNTNGAILGLALLMAYSVPVLAGTVTLSGVTGNSCSSYTGYSADANGNLTVTCAADTAPAPTPTGAPVCSLTASPTTISAGATSTLIATCSPVATSYAWTGSGAGTFTAGGTVSPSNTTTYTVIGTNDIGPGNTASVVVTVSSTTSSGTVAPTSTSSIEEIKRWNYAFETINYMPHNYKWEPVYYMSYLKQMQLGKPTQYHLPTSW